ncbi:MAG: DUF2147 domain-containing protein [Bacteroidia bacterium]
MTSKVFFSFFMLCFFACTSVLAQTPIGRWKTIDDETGKPKSIMKIWEDKGKLYGVVEQLFREPNEDQDPICDKCTDYRKNKKIKGMILLSGLSKSGKEWSGGTITDPNNGKTYSCYISMESPDKLKVRGYIGVSALGRTQYWHRVK